VETSEAAVAAPFNLKQNCRQGPIPAGSDAAKDPLRIMLVSHPLRTCKSDHNNLLRLRLKMPLIFMYIYFEMVSVEEWSTRGLGDCGEVT